jgi:hypothetical protein
MVTRSPVISAHGVRERFDCQSPSLKPVLRQNGLRKAVRVGWVNTFRTAETCFLRARQLMKSCGPTVVQ